MLGADDPEMRMIELILFVLGLPYVYATINGWRCHPGNVYRADPVKRSKDWQLVAIECLPANFLHFPERLLIDHHNLSDSEAHMEPKDFWFASSIGRLHELLKIKQTDEARIVAATDHVSAAAIEGLCPGISRNEALNCRIDEVARETGLEKKSVETLIDYFSKVISNTNVKTIDGQYVWDLRNLSFHNGYTLEFLALQIAAMRENVATLVRFNHYVGDVDRIMLTGNPRPETVESFMKHWAPGHHLHHVYGVPMRRYGLALA